MIVFFGSWAQALGVKPIACLAFLVIASTVGAEKLPATVWRKVKTYDMAALQRAEPLPMRQIVAVRFNYRSKDIRHLKPTWFYSSIWSQRRAGGKVQFDSIPVMVAMSDVAALKAVSTNPQSPESYVVYGQVLEDSEAKFLFLRLLGTKVKRDRRGGATITW